MERKDLVNEITRFCLEYNIFEEQSYIDGIKSNVEKNLTDIAFVEVLSSAISKKAKIHNIQKDKRTVQLLFELAKLRLTLKDR